MAQRETHKASAAKDRLLAYLAASGADVTTFARLTGVAPARLRAAIDGAGDLTDAETRRIAAATDAPDPDARARAGENGGLNRSALKEAVSIALGELIHEADDGRRRLAGDLVVEAAGHAYLALSAVADLPPGRLFRMALRPVLEAAVLDFGGRATPESVQRATALAGEMYFQGRTGR